jgi:predicted PurR-regulated permease PerM
MRSAKEVQKVLALGFLLAIGAVLAYALLPFVNALFGALVLFVLLKPIHVWLVKRSKLPVPVAATVVILLALVIIVVPFVFVGTALLGEADSVSLWIKSNEGAVANSVRDFIHLDVDAPAEAMGEQMFAYLQAFLFSMVSQIAAIAVNLFIMFFLLYYLLAHVDHFHRTVRRIIPFNHNHTDRLIRELKTVTRATILTTGLVALLQGTLLIILLTFFGIPNALFWGFIGGLMSVIPVLGTPLIYVPVVFATYIAGDISTAIGIGVGGLFISTIDNLVRPQLNSAFGSIHPVISLLGIFLGVPIFGMIGIVAGPLLLSYFFLMVSMFNQEYLRKPQVYRTAKQKL